MATDEGAEGVLVHWHRLGASGLMVKQAIGDRRIL
jgi:hypothetical protein